MSSDTQSGLGSRLENSKQLIAIIKSYSQYEPILDLIKIPNYEAYVTNVENSMGPYYTAKQAFDLQDNVVKDVFNKIVDIVRPVRNVLIELYGNESGQYKDYNEIIDLITGDNIAKNSRRRKESDENPEEDFQSVAQVDRGSRLSNFTRLIEMLKNNPDYLPVKAELRVNSLETLRDDASAKNIALATAYGAYTSERAVILPLFDGPEGLTVRAERAKAHVRSVYGPQSPELKALTGKTY